MAQYLGHLPEHKPVNLVHLAISAVGMGLTFRTHAQQALSEMRQGNQMKTGPVFRALRGTTAHLLLQQGKQWSHVIKSPSPVQSEINGQIGTAHRALENLCQC